MSFQFDYNDILLFYIYIYMYIYHRITSRASDRADSGTSH
jgi:hypothetical protein